MYRVVCCAATRCYDDIGRFIMKRRLCIVFVVLVVFCFLIVQRSKYLDIYNEGVSLLEAGACEEAIDCFSEIPNYLRYRDISELLEEHDLVCPYCGHVMEEGC